jgi:hypothetical protein
MSPLGLSHEGASSLRRKGPQPEAPAPESTRTEAQMRAQLSNLDPTSKRYLVLRSAVSFKRSWLELAQHLAEVRKKSLFTEWGFRTFEAYAQHELHIRRDTAQKLVRSFDFLATFEQPTLEAFRQDDRALPDYRSLDILAEARENPALQGEAYENLKEQVFRDDPSPSSLRKIVRSHLPEVEHKADAGSPNERLRKCLALSERLYGLLLEENVGEGLRTHLEQVVGGLRRMLDD